MTELSNTNAARSGQLTNRQYATFFVDDLFFGVEGVRVQEVLRYQEMTPAPLAAQVIDGLINLRGQIVTALDMRRRLDLGQRPEGRRPVNLVVRSGDEAVSLLVDEIGDVVEPAADSFEEQPETTSPAVRELLRGVFKLEDRLLLILDTEKVLDLAGGGRREPELGEAPSGGAPNRVRKGRKRAR